MRAWIGSIAIVLAAGACDRPPSGSGVADSDGAVPVTQPSGCIVRVVGDRVEAEFTNGSTESVVLWAANTPWDIASPGFEIQGDEGVIPANGSSSASPNRSRLLLPGETVTASRDLAFWPLRRGATYRVGLASGGVHTTDAVGTPDIAECNVVDFSLGVIGVVEAPLSTHPTCSATNAAILDPAYPIVEGALHLSRSHAAMRGPLFRKWFGQPDALDDNSVQCALGYFDQILSDYVDAPFWCNYDTISCCTDGRNACTIWNPFEGHNGIVVSICDPLLNTPGGPALFGPSSLVGSMTHELMHAVGPDDVSHASACGPDQECSGPDDALALAEAQDVVQPCDHVYPNVWLSINSTENYEGFVQEVFLTTAGALSAAVL